MPERLKIVLFRVLQESLRNAVQHSGADRVTVTLHRLSDSVRLEIADNGRGFDTHKVTPTAVPHRGLGLGTMRERVSLSGGEMAVNSTPGLGTTIAVWWRHEGLA